MLKIAQDFWAIALEGDIQVTTRHVPGKKNITADFLSRLGQNHTEWKLDPLVAGNLILKVNFTQQNSKINKPN